MKAESTLAVSFWLLLALTACGEAGVTGEGGLGGGVAPQGSGGSPAATDGGSKVAVATISIETDGGEAITSKDTYIGCTITVDGRKAFPSHSGRGGIRGRGNSTWLWYDKKPYRIRLDVKAALLGLAEEKDWILLANYRDPTFLMSSYAFALAGRMGLPYSNSYRYAEVTLNGSYIGLYLLTEQVEQGTNRVNVPADGGVLLSLDVDDGPEMAPTAGDNFASSRYELPVCVKHPSPAAPALLSAIRDDFAKVENAIAAFDYDALAQVLDIRSFIDFVLLQEIVYNVELAAPRSMYMHKTPNGLFVMGPGWDFDGGFDFDWTTMMTGHDYFAQQELVLGTDPPASDTVSRFWLDMFKNARFVGEVKARWAIVRDTLLASTWGMIEADADLISDAMARNAARWPTGKDFRTEVGRMKTWLAQRTTVLDTTIAGYAAH